MHVIQGEISFRIVSDQFRTSSRLVSDQPQITTGVRWWGQGSEVLRWRSIIGRHLVQQSKNLEQELRRWAASRASREESHASGGISCRVSGEASRASGALGLLCSPTTLLGSRAVTWWHSKCRRVPSGCAPPSLLKHFLSSVVHHCFSRRYFTLDQSLRLFSPPQKISARLREFFY